MSLFGMPEIAEYEKTCTDPIVLAIIKRLHETRSANARWNDSNNELRAECAKQRDALNTIACRLGVMLGPKLATQLKPNRAELLECINDAYQIAKRILSK